MVLSLKSLLVKMWQDPPTPFFSSPTGSNCSSTCVCHHEDGGFSLSLSWWRKHTYRTNVSPTQDCCHPLAISPVLTLFFLIPSSTLLRGAPFWALSWLVLYMEKFPRGCKRSVTFQEASWPFFNLWSPSSCALRFSYKLLKEIIPVQFQGPVCFA